jgi:hypothetical protein
VTPPPANNANAADIPRRGCALAGWAAFRALRQRPAPVLVRQHGNHRHGRYAKDSVEERRRFRLYIRALRHVKLGDAVPGVRLPPEPSTWRLYRERRGHRP